MDFLIEAIAIGLFFSIMLSEIFGISVAGLVVPGYLAYYFDQPVHLFIILLAALYTWIVDRIASRITILYGKRIFALNIISSFILVYTLEKLVHIIGVPVPVVMDSIGYFIPALIVIYIGANGFIITVLSAALLTLLTRIVLIILGYLSFF